MTEKRGAYRIIFLICAVFAITAGLAYSELCAEGVRSGIELAVTRLIPSLFPFMVIADIIINTDALFLLEKTLGGLFAKLFSLSREGASAFLLGALFGFPAGIRSAIGLYEDGRIDYSELKRLFLFASMPSPAFFISAVGEGLFGSLSLGFALYLCSLATNIFIGVATRGLFLSSRGDFFCARGRGERSARGENAFISAVTSSARALFSISAFVVFFSMLSEVLELFLSYFGMGESLFALLFGAMEMTGGVARASALGERGVPLVAAILGFSGLSVFCQMLSITRGHSLPVGAYLISKLVCASFGFLSSLLLIQLFGEQFKIGEASLPSFALYRENNLTLVLFAFFLCASFMALREEKTKIFKKTIYKR